MNNLRTLLAVSLFAAAVSAFAQDDSKRKAILDIDPTALPKPAATAEKATGSEPKSNDELAASIRAGLTGGAPAVSVTDPVLDAESARKALGITDVLQTKMLTKFAMSASVAESIRAAVNSNRKDDATNAAIKLSDVARNVGAMRLATASSNIERVLKTDAMPSMAEIGALKAAEDEARAAAKVAMANKPAKPATSLPTVDLSAPRPAQPPLPAAPVIAPPAVAAAPMAPPVATASAAAMPSQSGPSAKVKLPPLQSMAPGDNVIRGSAPPMPSAAPAGAGPLPPPPPSGAERTIRDPAASLSAKNDTPNTLGPDVIMVTPGVNQLVPISRLHLNRIVVPIFQPVVKTTSDAAIESKGSVLYVKADSDSPIAIYLTRNEDDKQAIVLTLMPSYIPPREIQITTTADAATSFAASSAAQTWETQQPYVNTVRSIMRTLAQGAIPPGYQLRRHTLKDPAVFCSDPYLKITPIQVIDGANLIVTVAAIKNISSRDVEINEQSCQLPGVSAVAAYPTPYLRPGVSSELYVVHRRIDTRPPARSRPSVIDPDYLR